LHIIDDGHGFDSSKVASGGFGLGNMNERAGQIGASLKIDSKVNEGTEITVVWNDHTGEMTK
jgi:NarL family two-component system sensor histidine kinase LiaS